MDLSDRSFLIRMGLGWDLLLGRGGPTKQRQGEERERGRVQSGGGAEARGDFE